ncbi:MAG: class I SAM-dependent RNA methyltransferase, partial [Eggerthellaceae bacterium]|nr:class I SAM-dependent RNA methyltransferase [Eggerthellaceae bacterium]
EKDGDLGIFGVGVRAAFNTSDIEIALWSCPGAFPRSRAVKVLQSALDATGIVRVLGKLGSERSVSGVEVLHGRGNWEEKLGNCTYAVSAPGFFQVNTFGAQVLISVVKEFLGDVSKARIADLYAGCGTFGIALAKDNADVVAVESFGPSVRDLRRNAQKNNVDMDIVGGDAARELASLGKLDAVVFDPPRAGLAANVAEDIAKASPKSVVYVSCDPQTLARDIERFSRAGYRVEAVQPVDMFPQTYHVETVVLMSRVEV